MSASSDHLPVVPEEKPTLPSVLMALANLVFKRDAILWFAAVVVLLGAGGFGVVWAQDKLDGGTAKAVQPVADALRVETERLDQHLKDDAASKREVTQRLDESSADIRALYKAVMTGERQYRLERPLPLPDGGP